MGDSRRERIVKAVAAALAVPSVTIRGVVHSKPARLEIHRSRRRPLEEDRLPATVVYLVDEDVVLETHEPTTARTLKLRLEHRAKGAPEDQALDPLLSWGTRALLSDPSLGDLAFGVEETGVIWDGEERDDDYARAGQDFEIEYQTPEDDPEG